MRAKTIVIAALAVLCSTLAGRSTQAAEPPVVEIAGSYAYTGNITIGSDYPSGWLVSGSTYVSKHVGVVGEVGGSYQSLHSPIAGIPDLNSKLYDFAAGLKIASNRNGAARTFAQMLVGDAHSSNDFGSVDNLMLQPGVGVDVTMSGSLGLRFQGDYRIITSNGSSLKEFRGAVGLVFRK
jgi:hypothetical protein